MRHTSVPFIPVQTYVIFRVSGENCIFACQRAYSCFIVKFIRMKKILLLGSGELGKEFVIAFDNIAKAKIVITDELLARYQEEQDAVEL